MLPKICFLHWSMFENSVIVNAIVSVSTFVAIDLVLDFFWSFVHVNKVHKWGQHSKIIDAGQEWTGLGFSSSS